MKIDIGLDGGTFCVDEQPGERRKKLKVECGTSSVMYDITDYNRFPFQFGRGKYTVTLYQQVTGNKYRMVDQQTVAVPLKNEFAPFLNDNQYVRAAHPMVFRTIQELRNYIRAHCRYDYVRAFKTKKTILPDVDYVIAHNMGVCQDLAAFAVFHLRYMDVPARLMIGHADGNYHAWVEYFDDDKWIRYDPTAEVMGKKVKNYVVERWY